MKAMQKLKAWLTVAGLVVCLLIAVLVTVESSGRTLAAGSGPGAVARIPIRPAVSVETNNFNPDPMSDTVKLIFIHHSTGENWLRNNNGALLEALNDNHYYVSDGGVSGGPYDNIGSRTDIGDWYEWFADPTRVITITAWLYNRDNTRANAIPNPDDEAENEVIMFKSCFPNSNVWGAPDDSPNESLSPPRGFTPGSPNHNVSNTKRIYLDILNYFETRQDKLFIVVTAPPLMEASTTATWAANARAVNDWLMYEWLADYEYHNVAVFDFYNVLTSNGGDPDTNDLGWSTGNHHRVITTTTPITIQHQTDDDGEPNNYLEYPSMSGTNSHPSQAGNQKATGEFVPLLNVYYNCWKYSDCGGGATDWISVTAAIDVASIYPDETATFTLSVTASASFSAPVTLTLQGIPSGAVAAFVPNPVTPANTSQLHITTTASTATGTYVMTATGTSGQMTDTASLTLAVNPIFVLSTQPNVHTVFPGDTAAYTLSLTTSEDLAAPVTLILQGLPPGADASFVPSHITPPGISQLTIANTALLSPTTYAMTVTALHSPLALSDSVTISLNVTLPPTFTFNVSPVSRTVLAGNAVTFTAYLTALHGFDQLVDLSISDLPTGMQAAWNVNPLSPQPTGSSQLVLWTETSVPPGTYVLQTLATAGEARATAPITLTMTTTTDPSDFALVTTPTSRAVRPAQTITYTVSISSINGFSQSVSLSVLGLPEQSSSAWSANPASPGSTTTLSVTTSLLSPPGTYSLFIVGTASARTHSKPIELHIDYLHAVYLPLILNSPR